MQAVKDILHISVPATISLVSSLLMSIVNTAFIGHIGTENEVAGAGFAVMVSNIMCLSVLMGVCNAMNTLVSQAAGSKDFHVCGVQLNRARVVMGIIFVALFIPLQLAKSVFLMLGLDQGSATFAQFYINLALPGVFFSQLTEANKRLLNSMGHQIKPMIIQMFTSVLHLGICQVITISLGVGIYGPPIAYSISCFIMLIGMTLYTQHLSHTDSDLKKAWTAPIRNALHSAGLIEFMKIGVPSIGMQCLEFWSFELMTILAAQFSIQAVASQIIVINNSHIFFMPHYGLQLASLILIGESIGAQHITLAKRYNNLAQIMGSIQSLILALILFFGRNYIAEFYTSIPDLQGAISSVLSVYAFYHLLDGNKSVSCGAMRGLAKQTPATYISLLAYYVISLPFQYLFGFYLGMGVIGLWVGQFCAASFHLFSLLFLMYIRYDWVAIGIEAYKRLQDEREFQKQQESLELANRV